MSDKQQNTVLAWIDLETTGLKPDKDRILEYAVVFTDLELNELVSKTNIVNQPGEQLIPLMDEYVIQMHSDNGLLHEIGQGEQIPYVAGLVRAQQEMMDALDQARSMASDHEVEVIFVIAGNTVGFDKGFIKAQMPELFDLLHYRQLDVSSYKVGFPEIFGTKTSAAHRAMADIRASIEQQAKMRRIVAAAGRSVGVNTEA